MLEAPPGNQVEELHVVEALMQGITERAIEIAVQNERREIRRGPLLFHENAP
jgi:hypothetical protein